MKVLITGCCGTTGTSLVKYLLENTDDIIYGVDNFYKEGSRENLEEIKKHSNYHGRFFFSEKSITSPSFYEDINFQCKNDFVFDGIYNLAAIVETPRFYDSPYETYRVNCQGAIDLFKWACDNKVKKFVNASSSEIYGHSTNFPTQESDSSIYDGVEVSTRWSYAHGKILTEYVMNQLSDMYEGNTKVCHLRYANVYGEHDLTPVHVIPYFLDKIINNEDVDINSSPEDFYRTFLHNDDSTLGTYLAMKNMINKHSYNIGSSEEVSIYNLFNMCRVICSKYGYSWDKNLNKTIFREGDPKKRWLDTNRAKNELGFTCKVPLVDGITKMVLKKIKNREEEKK